MLSSDTRCTRRCWNRTPLEIPSRSMVRNDVKAATEGDCFPRATTTPAEEEPSLDLCVVEVHTVGASRKLQIFTRSVCNDLSVNMRSRSFATSIFSAIVLTCAKLDRGVIDRNVEDGFSAADEDGMEDNGDGSVSPASPVLLTWPRGLSCSSRRRMVAFASSN